MKVTEVTKWAANEVVKRTDKHVGRLDSTNVGRRNDVEVKTNHTWLRRAQHIFHERPDKFRVKKRQ